MKYCARKWCRKLCTFFLEAICAFGRMCQLIFASPQCPRPGSFGSPHGPYGPGVGAHPAAHFPAFHGPRVPEYRPRMSIGGSGGGGGGGRRPKPIPPSRTHEFAVDPNASSTDDYMQQLHVNENDRSDFCAWPICILQCKGHFLVF